MTDKQFHGHVTLEDGTHKALSEEEAAAIWEKIEQDDAQRAADMPTEQDALKVMNRAYRRLHDLGWREAIYCPKDGSTFDAIEPGSTGIHDCFYMGDWPTGSWKIVDEIDVWPSHPILFKRKDDK